MVESIGMQQVLQLSAVVEKAHMAQQTVGSEVARSFEKELKKKAEREGDQTQAVNETPEELLIKDEDHKKPQQEKLDAKQREKEEEKEAAPPSESGHGKIINVVA